MLSAMYDAKFDIIRIERFYKVFRIFIPFVLLISVKPLVAWVPIWGWNPQIPYC